MLSLFQSSVMSYAFKTPLSLWLLDEDRIRDWLGKRSTHRSTGLGGVNLRLLRELVYASEKLLYSMFAVILNKVGS